MGAPNCNDCPLGQKRSRVVVPPQYPTNGYNGLVIVGEQPSSEEADQKIPFVGPSGRLLDSILAQVGIDRSACFVTNAFQCYHKGDLPDRDRDAAARACRPRLIDELRSANARGFLLLGGTATKALLREPASVDELRGSMLRSSVADLLAPDVPQAWATCSFHPARILRGSGQEYDILFADVEKVARWLREPPADWHDSYILGPKPDVVREHLGRWATTIGGITCDIETVGRMNRWLCDIRLIGFGWKDLALVVPMLDGEWQQFYTKAEHDEVCSLLRSFLADERFFTTFHNLQFDVPVLERYGFHVAGMIHDTLEQHFALYHKGVRHALGYVAQQYLDVPPWKTVHEGDHEKSDLASESVYNSRDVRVTGALHDTLLSRLLTESLWHVYRMGIENNCIAWQMSKVGFNVNPKLHEEAINEWQKARVLRSRDLLEVAEIGPRQSSIMDRVAKGLKVEALLHAKADSFAAGDLNASDISDLVHQATIVSEEIVHKKGQRELEEIIGELNAHMPIAFPRLSTFTTIHNAGVYVKAQKKSKDPISAEVFEVVKRVAPSVEAQTPEDLKKLKVADWADLERPFKADVSRLAQLSRTAMTRVKRQIGRYPFVNFQSGYEAGLVFHSDRWFNLQVLAPLNSKGEYTVDEDALAHVKGHPLIKTYQDMKTAHKRWTRLVGYPIYPDGRIHPVFKTHDISGRWSSGDSGSDADVLDTYNAQNEEAMFMSLFTAPPGKKYVGADFSGLELRVVAVQTGCKTLMGQFDRADAKKDLKVHAQTARLIWKEHVHLPLDEQRQHYEEGKRYKIAKSGGFLIVYGGQEDTLATKIINEEPYEPDPQARARRESEIRDECRALFRALEKSWGEIFENRKRWYDEAMTTGRLRTGWLTGRFLRFPLRDRDHISPTLCANAPVQTTAGEIAHTALRKVFYAIPKQAKVVLYIHDCLIIEVDESMAEEVKHIMSENMRYYFDGPSGGLTCFAEPKIGDSILDVK